MSLKCMLLCVESPLIALIAVPRLTPRRSISIARRLDRPAAIQINRRRYADGRAAARSRSRRLSGCRFGRQAADRANRQTAAPAPAAADRRTDRRQGRGRRIAGARACARRRQGDGRIPHSPGRRRPGTTSRSASSPRCKARQEAEVAKRKAIAEQGQDARGCQSRGAKAKQEALAKNAQAQDRSEPAASRTQQRRRQLQPARCQPALRMPAQRTARSTKFEQSAKPQSARRGPVMTCDNGVGCCRRTSVAGRTLRQ